MCFVLGIYFIEIFKKHSFFQNKEVTKKRKIIDENIMMKQSVQVVLLSFFGIKLFTNNNLSIDISLKTWK